MTSPPPCCDCGKKDAQIEYFKALLALNGLDGTLEETDTRSGHIQVVAIKQQMAILRQQVSLVRADAQYFNRQVQSVLMWIARVITVFLECCGRVSESAASTVVHSASSVISNVSSS